MNLNYELKYSDDITFVFLHGWGMSSDSFARVIGYMGNVSVLNLDFFGFGKSSQPAEYFDTYEYAYRVFLLLKRLNIGKVVLVGHSFGGRVAMILSSIFNIDIIGLCLTSSAGLTRKNIWVKLKIWRYKILKFLYRNKSEKLSKFGSDDYKQLNPVMKKVFVRVVNQDLKYLLQKIQTKTFLIWGKNDKSTPVSFGKIFHKGIKNSRLIVFKNGGHFAYYHNAHKFSKYLLELSSQRNN